MEKKIERTIVNDYCDVKAKIIGVSGEATIARIANEKGLNPQEVFVRVIFEVQNEDGSTVEANGSNQLRFFGKEGYLKLLKAQETGEVITLTLRHSDKGDVIYVKNPNNVTVDNLFEKPLEKKSNTKSIADLMNLLK